MPIHFGKIIPEIESSSLLQQELTLFVDIAEPTEEVLKLLEDVCTLSAYIKDIAGSSVELVIQVQRSQMAERFDGYGVQQVETYEHEISSGLNLLLLASRCQCDVLVSPSADVIVLSNKRLAQAPLILNCLEARECIEAFVRGHDIPWSFDTPSWFMPWQVFYSMCDKRGIEAIQYYNRTLNTSWSHSAKEFARSLLLNRVSHISYTFDKLRFYKLQKELAKWKGLSRQEFRFELNYHLDTYRLFFSAGLDQLARLVHDVLELKMEYRDISFSAQKFVNKICGTSESMRFIVIDKAAKAWIKKLQFVRNYIAHQGVTGLTKIVRDPISPISDADLEKEVDKSLEAQLEGVSVDSQKILALRSVIKENLRISQMEILEEDIEILNLDGYKIKLRPLDSVDYDKDMFFRFTFSVINALLSHK